MRNWIAVALAAFALAGMAPALAQAPLAGASQRSTDPAVLPKVFSVRVTVADLDAAERFYRDGLGATNIVRVHDRERVAQFPSSVAVVLVQGPPRAAGAAAPHGNGGFILQVTDIDAVVARTAPAGGAVERPPNSGQDERSYGVRASQIRDPDGVGIELIQFPPGGPRQPR